MSKTSALRYVWRKTALQMQCNPPQPRAKHTTPPQVKIVMWHHAHNKRRHGNGVWAGRGGVNTEDWKIQRAMLVSLAGSDEGEVGIITVVMALKANETSDAVEHRPGASARRCHQRRPPRCPPPRDRPFQPSAGRRRRRTAMPPALLRLIKRPNPANTHHREPRLHSRRKAREERVGTEKLEFLQRRL